MATLAELALREEGYLVDITFHKVRTATTVDPKVLGINVEDNEQLQTFYNNHVKKTQMTWLSTQNIHLRKAQSISKSVHKRKILDSLDGKSYLPKAKLPSFKAFMKKKNEEYLKVRDNLVDEYDIIVHQFRQELEADFLNETVSDHDERQILMNAIMSKVPSKEEVYDSFRIEQNYMLFAMTSELMDDEDKAESQEMMNKRINEMNGVTLSVVFEKLSLVMTALWEKHYTKTHHDKVDEAIVEITQRNIFKNSYLEELKKEIIEGKEEKSLGKYELLLTKIYREAKSIGEDHRLDIGLCPLTLPQLEANMLAI